MQHSGFFVAVRITVRKCVGLYGLARTLVAARRLASQDASYITGVEINVDGGLGNLNSVSLVGPRGAAMSALLV
jgi:hypothetical protein